MVIQTKLSSRSRNVVRNADSKGLPPQMNQSQKENSNKFELKIPPHLTIKKSDSTNALVTQNKAKIITIE